MNRNKVVVLALGTILLGISSYGFLLEPNRIEVRHVRIKDSAPAKVLEGRVAVHVSDLHISKIGEKERTILDLINSLSPDFIFLTGDYVAWKGDYEPALEFLSRLEAKSGIWAVMGEYDYSNSRMSCLFCHEPGTGKPTQRHEVRFLRDTVERVDLGAGFLLIGGLDGEREPWSIRQNSSSEWKKKWPKIILSHSPLSFDQFDEDDEILMLSGDTHGGQVPIPAWVWKMLGYEKNARYSHGLYEKGRAKMFVSKGVGTSHVPFRFLRQPEVVVLHFEE